MNGHDGAEILKKAYLSELAAMRRDMERSMNRMGYGCTPVNDYTWEIQTREGPALVDIMGNTTSTGDWSCSYCKGKQPETVYSCGNCGGPKL